MVPRETKTPEERRREIISTARRLFEERGFTSTSVDDIVEEMGVAKGTYYYYFKSKNEVLEAIIGDFLDEMESRSNDVADKEGPSALDKYEALMVESERMKRENPGLVTFFHTSENEYLHHDIAKQGIGRLIPPLTRIIEQGIREGVFDTRHPRVTAAALLISLGMIGDELSDLVGKMKAMEFTTEDRVRIVTAFDEATWLTERLLGMEEGSFTYYDKYMEAWK